MSGFARGVISAPWVSVGGVVDPSLNFTFMAGQLTASPYYSNRTDAFIEIVSPEALTIKVIDGGVLKNGGDAPESPLDTRVSNVRIPAGHWLVLSRAFAEKELQIRLRRTSDGSGILNSPLEVVSNDSFKIEGNKTVGLIRNSLTRPLAYRLFVRSDVVNNEGIFYVQSGADAIHPLSGSFILDTVIPGGGALELRGLNGGVSGSYDLHVDP